MTVLAGVDRPEPVPWAPFDPRVTNFLEQLSAEVLRHPETRGEAGVAAFAFWCRRGHLTALARRHETPLPRLGVGLVFHIAPGNVPVMFAYTLAIGLLAGNANIVRLSRHRADGDTALLEALRRVSERHEHAQVRRRFSLVTYPRDEKITAAYCAACDGRVVWGGDETVAAVRAMPMPPTPWSSAFLTGGPWLSSASPLLPPWMGRRWRSWPAAFTTIPTRWTRTPAPALS